MFFMNYKTDKIKKARLIKGWSITRLAKEAGLAYQTVASVETGPSPQPASVKAIADALGLRMEDLVQISQVTS